MCIKEQTVAAQDRLFHQLQLCQFSIGGHPTCKQHFGERRLAKFISPLTQRSRLLKALRRIARRLPANFAWVRERVRTGKGSAAAWTLPNTGSSMQRIDTGMQRRFMETLLRASASMNPGEIRDPAQAMSAKPRIKQTDQLDSDEARRSARTRAVQQRVGRKERT
jgi:hypothetical protein